jgi:hypothetical protein
MRKRQAKKIMDHRYRYHSLDVDRAAKKLGMVKVGCKEVAQTLKNYAIGGILRNFSMLINTDITMYI